MGKEMNSIAYFSAQMGFLLQAEFADFRRVEETDDDVDTFHSPPRDLVFEPIASAWAGHDCQTPRFPCLDPMNL
jgi:hypothetical protein